MKRAGLLAVLLLTLVFPLSGCWDGVELQKRAIVLMIGIDPAAGQKVKVSVQLALPHKLGALAKGQIVTGGQRTASISQEGIDVGEALQKIQLAVDRRLFFGHLQAIVINEQLARGRVLRYLNPLIQARIVSRKTWLFVSAGPAEEVTKMEPKIDPIPSTYLTNFFTNEILLNRPHEGTIGGWHQRIVTPGVEPFSFWIGGNGSLSAPRIQGIAVFSQDRFVGMLPRDLFVGWSLVDNQFPKVTMDFSCPSGDGQFVVDVTSVHSQIRFQPASSGSMSAHVDIRVVGHVQGGMCVQDTSLARLHELEQAVARQVETMAQDSIRTCQKQWGVDIFGMGLALYRQHPGQWPGDEVWRNTFPRLQVDVHASARLDFAQTYQMSAAEVLS